MKNSKGFSRDFEIKKITFKDFVLVTLEIKTKR